MQSDYLSTTHHEVPVSVDAVSQASDEECEVCRGEEEGGDRDEHHPALQQGHGHVGGGHQDPYQATKQLKYIFQNIYLKYQFLKL